MDQKKLEETMAKFEAVFSEMELNALGKKSGFVIGSESSLPSG